MNCLVMMTFGVAVLCAEQDFEDLEIVIFNRKTRNLRGNLGSGALFSMTFIWKMVL